ncbi:uncharacterized protein [Anas platyrhynchos]|uniref:uncharacterized protein n=1 Tax=Anas platyrhynchos TaxID=8839 RepID=UPI003AF25E74
MREQQENLPTKKWERMEKKENKLKNERSILPQQSGGKGDFQKYLNLLKERCSRKVALGHSTFQNSRSAVYRHPLCRKVCKEDVGAQLLHEAADAGENVKVEFSCVLQGLWSCDEPRESFQEGGGGRFMVRLQSCYHPSSEAGYEDLFG